MKKVVITISYNLLGLPFLIAASPFIAVVLIIGRRRKMWAKAETEVLFDGDRQARDKSKWRSE